MRQSQRPGGHQAAGVGRGCLHGLARRHRSMRLDQALERGLGAGERASVVEQTAVVMSGEHDAEQLEAELPGVGLRLEVPRIDRKADGLGDRPAQLALAGDEHIPYRPRAVVVFDRSREHYAAPRRIFPFEPGEPVGEQGAKARQPACFLQGRQEHALLKKALRLLESENLEVFLGTEVREQAAFGESKPRGERTDAQALESDLTGEGHRLVENHAASFFSFAHPWRLARTFVFYKIQYNQSVIQYDVENKGQVERKCAATARSAAHPYLTPEPLRQLFADGEAETGSSELPVSAPVDLLEGLENELLLVLGDSHPGVANRKRYSAMRPVQLRVPRRPARFRSRNAQSHAALPGELERVGEEVPENLPQALGVGFHGACGRFSGTSSP